MYNRKDVKLWAKRALHGNWLTVFKVSVCLMAGYYVLNLTSALFGSFAIPLGDSTTFSVGSAIFANWAYSALCMLPMMVSASYFFLRLFRGDAPSFGSAFRTFSSFHVYARCLKGMLWVGLWYVLWSLTPLYALAGLMVTSAFFGVSAGVSMVMGPIFLVATIALAILSISKTLGYVFTPFILAEYPQIGGRRALSMSKIMANGYKLVLVELWFSFILWMLAGALIFVILFIFGFAIAGIMTSIIMCTYVTPYILTSLAGAYDRIKLTCIDEGLFEGVAGFESVWSELNGSAI